MVFDKQLGKAHDGGDGGADFVAHVAEEDVLDVLHLLGLQLLALQFPLRGPLLGHVAAEPEIVLNLSPLVTDGEQVELERQRLVVGSTDDGVDVNVDSVLGAHVHIVQHSHGNMLGVFLGQVQATGLRQRQLHHVHLLIDGQQVGLGRIIDQSHTADVEGEVDVVDVVGNVLGRMLQLVDVKLQLVVGVDELRHVASRAKDAEEAVAGVIEGHQLLLIVGILLDIGRLGQTVVVRGLDEMGRIAAFEVLQRDVGVFEGVVERHPFGQNLVTVAVEGLAGLLVDVSQDAFRVIIGHVHHRGREDGLIAQHVVLGLALGQQPLRLVVHHA